MDDTHLDIVILFAKPNGSIDHHIGDESVKKMILLFSLLNQMETWIIRHW